MKRRTEDEYGEFIKTKVPRQRDFGFKCDELNPMLYDWQADIVRWALRRGRAAIFADCGLGKTPMQLEWANRVHLETGGDVLILAPLAVSAQTKREGIKFGVTANVCRSQADVTPGVSITNYENMHKFDCGHFAGVVIDESSILKSYTGKYKTEIIEGFRNAQFRLACTATPAPNDHMEIGNHSDFLGVMPSNEMLARWFINDTMNMGRYRLKKYAISDFWEWVSSWAVCLQKPSDLGGDDAGFILPELREELIEVRADATIATPGMLFRMPDLSATGMHQEMRITAPVRAQRAAEIVGSDSGAWVIWCNTNYEADELKTRIPEAVDIRGSMTASEKEDKLIGFVHGRHRVIITKPDIAGFGMNWQHCHNQVFTGLSYSYEKYYQAVRRCWRYGQTKPVNVYLVIADTERAIYERVMVKARAHEEMQSNMYNSVRNIHFLEDRELNMDVERRTESGEDWTMHLGDCVEAVRGIKSGSVDFTIFSPPFSSLYIYSDSIRDMGNSEDDAEFFRHFGFLIPELYRVTRPGRLCAVHCKQLVYYKNQRGSAGLRDFRGEIIRAFTERGWDYHSEVTIWKDPVTEMQRTKAHGLLHKQLCKDSTFSRQGLPDYLVIFRKWAKEGDDVKPVSGPTPELRFPHADGYIGNSGPESVESDRDHSIQVWQRYASPVWFDINQMRCLNTKAARDSQDEKHICPLQLDVIERAIHLWTNENDLVFSPFAGIGSEGFSAVKMGRRFVGIELKEAYFNQACANLRDAESVKTQASLFGN